MSTASTNSPIVESSETFEVYHAQRPTLRALCFKLEQLARLSKPQSDAIPVAVQACYLLSARATHRSKATGQGWHLRSPSCGNVAALSCEALVHAGYVQPGQVVHATGSKVLSDSSSNVLIVTIVKLDVNCKEDTKTRQHKLLEWYLEQCSIKNVQPTRTVYRALLKKLGNKPQKNSVQNYTNLDLKKELPSFLTKD